MNSWQGQLQVTIRLDLSYCFLATKYAIALSLQGQPISTFQKPQSKQPFDRQSCNRLNVNISSLGPNSDLCNMCFVPFIARYRARACTPRQWTVACVPEPQLRRFDHRLDVLEQRIEQAEDLSLGSRQAYQQTCTFVFHRASSVSRMRLQ